MAKWDERDPRWLVEHRDDGKNVNGWHWEEKNRLEWSKQHIGALLTSLPAAETGNLKITKLRELNGEVGGVRMLATCMESNCSCDGRLRTVSPCRQN